MAELRGSCYDLWIPLNPLKGENGRIAWELLRSVRFRKFQNPENGRIAWRLLRTVRIRKFWIPEKLQNGVGGPFTRRRSALLTTFATSSCRLRRSNHHCFWPVHGTRMAHLSQLSWMTVRADSQAIAYHKSWHLGRTLS